MQVTSKELTMPFGTKGSTFTLARELLEGHVEIEGRSYSPHEIRLLRDWLNARAENEPPAALTMDQIERLCSLLDHNPIMAKDYAAIRQWFNSVRPSQPPFALPDVELVSAAVHAAWMDSKRSKGIGSRMSETGEELMAPYAQLSEAAKELDRASVKAVYAAIQACSGTTKASEHVCGLKGFGAIGDVCPACATDRQADAQSPSNAGPHSDAKSDYGLLDWMDEDNPSPTQETEV